ncbi:MAG: hypothetical protein CM15mP49_33450 [Actinomycetota bacterium]|nr:MAG: hypothetical protein CM15mP49_33450 [Actinomycetota bacterium]
MLTASFNSSNVGDTLEPGEVVGWLLADEEKADNETRKSLHLRDS